jgi:outer membrane protein assembly factor BamB
VGNGRAGAAGVTGRTGRRTPRRGPKAASLVAVACLALPLAGCEAWFGEDDPPLPGTRVSVIEHQRTISPDVATRADEIMLPPPVANPDWPNVGGNPEHAPQHVQFAASPKLAWKASIGTGTSSARPWLPPPIVAGGRVYTLDTRHRVRAFDVTNGERLWSVDIASEVEDDDALAGALAHANGRIFVTAGFGHVVALDAATGKELWRHKAGLPVHAPPTAAGGRVFVITVENTLLALSDSDGRDLWPPHRAISDTARLLGSAAPAVAGDVVVAAFTSGDLAALRADNGRPIWTDTLASAKRTDEITALAQIRGLPVLDRGRVFALSQGGLLAAIDIRTGQRIWDRDIGGLNTPWLAGRYLFLVSNTGDLVCLSADNGRVYWVTALPRYEDEEEKKTPILWTGPILAGDRLIILGSNARAATISPYDGRILTRQTLEGRVSVPPVVAGGRLFVLTDDGELTVYQ